MISSNNGSMIMSSNINTTTAAATITNINLNQNPEIRMISLSSVNSSLSSSSSSYSMSPSSSSSSSTPNQKQLNSNIQNSKNEDKENDSGFEKETDSSSNSISNNNTNSIFIRVSIPDQNLQKVLKFNLDETVWNAKQRVLTTLAKEIKDGLNYGFYLPPFQGRAGKFLDDCRLLKEYSLNGPVAQLEFKYKKRVYKFVKINQKELKALNVKSNYKRFLDLIRTNQVPKANRLLEKGLDPNFHSDLGETPLSIATSLAEPRNMIMALYNGGAHLDFRSRDTLTPMHKASILGNDKALKTLLELGAFAEVRDGRMLTPLFYSILNSSSVQSIEYLLFNGSSIGVRDENNWQEIHHACKLGLSQHLDHLIYYGCDINAKNNSGNTPLHVCAIHNQENCARILMFRGCLRTERNLANQTAYDSAIISGNHAIADSIKSHKESDTVPIRDRPFYNTKRRSIYLGNGNSDCQSNYSLPINNSGNYSSLNSASSSQFKTNSRQSSMNENNISTLSSSNTTHTLIEWNNNGSVNSSLNNSITTSSASNHSTNTVMRSKSMPKLDDMNMNKNTSLYAITSATMIGFTETQNSKTMPAPTHPPPPPASIPPTISTINSGSSSPTSRSRSISSDDHGFGSASLSQMSGSPNIEYAYPRKRLYPSIPNRTFVCIKPFKPTQPGEIELKKGDIIELLSIGDSGFWEGRSNNNEGWFRANCVEEFSLPKDSTNQTDSIVVKRKTLFDLITQNELNVPRTVVLQRGKKGFGFVLRGAKTTDCKFEPTLEVPALQFLESVDKDSNADKAQLKPLDFVLEINGIDVTCKTHYECVKLIKKTGDTLALKVYTINTKTSNSIAQCFTNSSNLTSTSSCGLYQSPCNLALNNQTNNNNNNNRSQSYYAASTIASNKSNMSLMNNEYHHSNIVNSGPLGSTALTTGLSLSTVDLNSYMDRTKSLPSKKKPIPPTRNPTTTLTSTINSTNNSSTSNLTDSSSYSSNNTKKNYEPLCSSPKELRSTSSATRQALPTPSIISASSFRSTNNQNRKSNKNLSNTKSSVVKAIPQSQSEHEKSKHSLKSMSYAYGSISSGTPLNHLTINAINNDEEKFDNIKTKNKKRYSFSNENMSFMNSALAQIDELDKTLAEYDTNNNNDLCSPRSSNESDTILLASKTKLLANDANAASIRTRVPVRKPGITNGDIFNVNTNINQTGTISSSSSQHLNLNHKTLSVPNLFQLTNSNRYPAPPVPPTPPPHITNNTSSSSIPIPPPPLPFSSNSSSSSNQYYQYSNKKSHIYSSPSANNQFNGDLQSINNSAEVYDYSNQDKNLDSNGSGDYEPTNDYEVDINDITLDNFKKNQSDSNEPVADYDQCSLSSSSSNKIQMTTFNQSSPTNNNNKTNSNLILMMLKQQQQQQQQQQANNNNSSSPLTPRQIKQRNSAKRNSVPRSSSSNPPNVSTNKLTPIQQRDLNFLQTQKFEADFMQTTKDLFARYPNAKISISVTISSVQNGGNSQPQTQSMRQIEIDRLMFEKICAFQQPVQKIQPQTPIRTTSISTAAGTVASASNNGYHSVSSSSPSSSSTSSASSTSAYDTGILQNEQSLAPSMMVKQDELNEAIKRAAVEHQLKRQSNINVEKVNASQIKQQTTNNKQSNFQIGSAAVKNELERALENRLRKQQQQQQQDQQQSDVLKPKEQQVVGSKPSVVSSINSSVNKRNVPRDPPPPIPIDNVSAELITTVIVQHSIASVAASTTNIPPPPPPPMSPIFSRAKLLSNNSSSSFPPPPSPLALRRLSSVDTSNVNKSPVSPGPPPPPPPLPNQSETQSTTSNETKLNVKSIINNYQQTAANQQHNALHNHHHINLLDPRSSSDFSELIAKKAAEKRAKFHESKPVSNAVTYQPDGSKVFVSNSAAKISDSNVATNIDNSNNTFVSNNANKLAASKTKQNESENSPLISSNNNNMKKSTVITNTNIVLTQVQKLANNANSNKNNAQSLSVTHSDLNDKEAKVEQIEEDSKSHNKLDMNSTRNESFINTASKLLERVKQQQQSMMSDELKTSSPLASPTIAHLKQNSIIAQQTQNQQPSKNIKC